MNYYRNDIESNKCDFSMPFCSPIRYFAAMNLLLPAPQSKRICKVSTHKTWRFSQTHSEHGKKPSSQSPQADHPTNMKKLMYDSKTTHWKSNNLLY